MWGEKDALSGHEAQNETAVRLCIFQMGFWGGWGSLWDWHIEGTWSVFVKQSEGWRNVLEAKTIKSWLLGFSVLPLNFFPTSGRSGFGALAVGFYAGSRVQGVRIKLPCLFLENRGWEDLSLVPAEGSHGLGREAAGLVISVFKHCFFMISYYGVGTSACE